MLEAIASQNLWIWHAFFGVAGANNDLNVLDNSLLFDDILNDIALVAPFEVNGVGFENEYYLADGIYPQWPTFVKSFMVTNDEKHSYFKKQQEGARKDAERAFGVLQGRCGIIQQPSRQYHVNRIRRIMYSCIIKYNMILEDQNMAFDVWNDMYANPSRNMQRTWIERCDIRWQEEQYLHLNLTRWGDETDLHCQNNIRRNVNPLVIAPFTDVSSIKPSSPGVSSANQRGSYNNPHISPCEITPSSPFSLSGMIGRHSRCPSAGSNRVVQQREEAPICPSGQLTPPEDDDQWSKKPRELSSNSSKKLKGIQTLTPAEQEAADIMKALKESKKMSKRQPGTGGSNEGTESLIVASRAVDPVGSPSSTTIDQDEQSTSTSPTNQEIQSQVTHQGPVPQFMAPDHSSLGPVLHEMMFDHNSSVLAPQRQEMSVENVSSGLVPQEQKALDYDNSDPVPPRQNVVPTAEKTDSLQ
ncbi:ALP1-like protein [Tanacetum coccineum]